jgi:hypothetical protein
MLRRMWLTLLLFLLPGAMTAVEAAGRGTQHAVMAGIVTGDAADTLQATPRLGVTSRNRRQRCGGEYGGGGLHVGNPFIFLRRVSRS